MLKVGTTTKRQGIFVKFGDRNHFAIAKYEGEKVTILDRFEMAEGNNIKPWQYKKMFLKQIQNNVGETTTEIFLDEGVANYFKRLYPTVTLF